MLGFPQAGCCIQSFPYKDLGPSPNVCFMYTFFLLLSRKKSEMVFPYFWLPLRCKVEQYGLLLGLIISIAPICRYLPHKSGGQVRFASRSCRVFWRRRIELELFDSELNRLLLSQSWLGAVGHPSRWAGVVVSSPEQKGKTMDDLEPTQGSYGDLEITRIGMVEDIGSNWVLKIKNWILMNS